MGSSAAFTSPARGNFSNRSFYRFVESLQLFPAEADLAGWLGWRLGRLAAGRSEAMRDARPLQTASPPYRRSTGWCSEIPRGCVASTARASSPRRLRSPCELLPHVGCFGVLGQRVLGGGQSCRGAAVCPAGTDRMPLILPP